MLGFADDFGLEEKLEVLEDMIQYVASRRQYTAAYVLDVAQRPVDHGILEGAHGGKMCGGTTDALATRSAQAHGPDILRVLGVCKGEIKSESVVVVFETFAGVRRERPSAVSMKVGTVKEFGSPSAAPVIDCGAAPVCLRNGRLNTDTKARALLVLVVVVIQ